LIAPEYKISIGVDTLELRAKGTTREFRARHPARMEFFCIIALNRVAKMQQNRQFCPKRIQHAGIPIPKTPMPAQPVAGVSPPCGGFM
jgi:hypothetical protein